MRLARDSFSSIKVEKRRAVKDLQVLFVCKDGGLLMTAFLWT